MTAFVLSAVLAVTAPVPKGADEKFQKAVASAREKAIDYLKKEQENDGRWKGGMIERLGQMNGGTSALVTLALLEAGVKADDPAVARAVKSLADLGSDRTYIVSLQTRVLSRADPKKYKEQIQKNADWLLAKAIKRNNRLDGWSYPQNEVADNSNTHFAVMGLHEATQAGAKIDPKVWDQIRDYYARTQRKDGSWCYYNASNEAPSISMTGCGLLGLTVANKHIKNPPKPDREFELGMTAYVRDVTLRSSKSTFHNLMIMSELGRTIGEAEFKSGDSGKEWYREGVELLLGVQNEKGSFSFEKGQLDADPLLATAYGLYFLGPPATAKK